jgi:uncharacterized protein (UPF0332 family)
MPLKMNWRKVTILNPEHLLEQSERLIQRGVAGAPRQVDLRRAVSSAYYSVFHATMTAAADNLMGRTRRSSAQYALAYRSIDHKSLRDICEEIRRPTLRDRYKPYEPAGGFGNDIRAFAQYLLGLQQKRHAADYDPAIRFASSEARASVSAARGALIHLQNASDMQRTAFLSLLVFPPR